MLELCKLSRKRLTVNWLTAADIKEALKKKSLNFFHTFFTQKTKFKGTFLDASASLGLGVSIIHHC